jgi:hypothetical protein
MAFYKIFLKLITYYKFTHVVIITVLLLGFFIYLSILVREFTSFIDIKKKGEKVLFGGQK